MIRGNDPQFTHPSTAYRQALQTGAAGNGRDSQKVMLRRCLFDVLQWAYPELKYSYHSIGDPMLVAFHEVNAAPDVVLRVGVGSSAAIVELCKTALQRALSFVTLQERLDYIRGLFNAEGWDCSELSEFASERYRQLEREEF